jgi:hypothetical protein
MEDMPPKRNTLPESEKAAIPDDLEHQNFMVRLWAKLLQFGLGESALRLATGALSLILVGVVIFVMSRFYTTEEGAAASVNVVEMHTTPIPTLAPAAPQFSLAEVQSGAGGVPKQAALHTILPSRERTEVVSYVIQQGDSLFSIAEKFGLLPETILWGNRYTLGEDPHTIFPGQTLNILPMDGVLHQWSAGEGLNGVAEFYQVTPEDIINYPPNGLNMATIGDYAAPNIEPGKMLIIPGGKGVFTDWRTPRITRDNPATAKHVGPGACTGSYDGITGTLTFIWPSTERYLSGYEYSPTTNHWGIDIAGKMGNPIYASDNGVVVYAGWNDWGYGEMIVIDHGDGWQTLYAHLSVINVGCGQEVYQGDTIGLMGSTGSSTGPHLHFEMRHDEYGRVNPWDFLQ